MEGQQSQSFSPRISNFPLKKVQVQNLIDHERKEEKEEQIHFIEQFVSEVLDFSSQYGSDTSISYTAYNLTGKPSKFPDYGDFPQAFVMKTYGNWWKEAPSKSREFMPQNTPAISSNDFVDVAFEQSVYPFRVCIYETYNPGSVVRIWARNELCLERKWFLLWEGEAVKIGHVPRMFSPMIRMANFKTSILRIEFNHSKLDYYTGIDAVLLVGTKELIKGFINNKFLTSNVKDNSDSSSHTLLRKLTQQVVELNLHTIPNKPVDLQKIVQDFQTKKLDANNCKENCNLNGSFSCLPDETILKILSYLDLKSLRSCARLNRHFHSLANDSFLYTSLSLKPYWSQFDDNALISLGRKCQHLQKLDLSWCGSYNAVSSSVFKRFLISCCSNLTNIRLNCCKFVTNSVIKTVASHCWNLKEIGLRNCVSVDESGFLHLNSLSQLEILDLYRTNITTSSLIAILKVNPSLLHLNLGSCIKINMDQIAITLSIYNKKLISLDFWKTSNLTQIGVAALSRCVDLEEVDFGWCLGFALPVDSLSALASGCPRLKKLFLTALRGICDKDLEPFVRECPDLEQIDLLGVRGITADICLRLLRDLPKLRLLDISFCDQISDSHVSNWKNLFPNVAIKRSFQTEISANSVD